MSIGNNIKKCRKEKGLTQIELALASKISRNALINYENDKRVPNLDTLEKIRVALDVSLIDLASNEEDKHKLENKINDLNIHIEKINEIVLSNNVFLSQHPKFKHLTSEQIEFFYKRYIKKLQETTLDIEDLPSEAIQEIKDFIEFIKYKYKK